MLLPLAAPGVFVAVILVYIPLFSEFATPALVGGRSGYMLGSLANSLILEEGNWGAGAALNFLLLVASALVAVLAYYLSKLNTHRPTRRPACPTSSIAAVAAREVLDCRGLPTVQVDVTLSRRHGRPRRRARRALDRIGRGAASCATAAAGSAVSASGPPSRTCATGSAPALRGMPVSSQLEIDRALLELDGTADKSGLGANAILGVSLAAARAAAAAAGDPLYRHLRRNAHVMPVPLLNLINGGKHASNDLDFQEFIVLPVGADSLLHALQIGTEINLALGEILLARFGKVALNTGDEGGYAPPMSSPEEALGFLHEAAERAGYGGDVVYGLDCAATHLYDEASGTYTVDGERYDRAALIELYQRLIGDYGIVTIEDPLHEDDFEGFAELTAATGIQIVGDDLFVTNPARVAEGVAPGRRQCAALEGQPDRHADRGARRRRPGAPLRLPGGRLGALGRDRGSDHRRPGGGAGRGPDQDRRAGARRAHEQVQPPDRDRGGARRHGRVPRPQRRPRPGARCVNATRPALIGNRRRHCSRTARSSCAPPSSTWSRPGSPPAIPGDAVERLVALDGDALVVDGVPHDLRTGRLLVMGAGKATLSIAAALQRILGDRIDGGLVVVPRGHGRPLGRIEVVEADHPLPTEASLAAAQPARRAGGDGGTRRSRAGLLHRRLVGARLSAGGRRDA